MESVSRADELYRVFVKKAGLFGQAFFGHKKTRAQTKRLNYLWKRAQKLASEENKNEP